VPHTSEKIATTREKKEAKKREKDTSTIYISFFLYIFLSFSLFFITLFSLSFFLCLWIEGKMGISLGFFSAG